MFIVVFFGFFWIAGEFTEADVADDRAGGDLRHGSDPPFGGPRGRVSVDPAATIGYQLKW